MANIKIPHGLVVVWNYDDRGTADGFDDLNGVARTIKLTVSCVSIRTTKTKGSPAGSFEFVLAPTENWATQITPGSWCAILMSNRPITQADISKANSETLKMIGRIETVRADVKVREDGSRVTYYTASGTDWGGIFNYNLYFDPYIDNDLFPTSNMFITIEAMLKKNINDNQDLGTLENIRNIVSIFGKPIPGLQLPKLASNILDTSMFTLKIPNEMKTFLGSDNDSLTSMIDVAGGRLVGEGEYDNKSESWGILDPYSFQGQHTFWQVLLAHSNPAINEMFPEITWEEDSPTFTLFVRVRPFNLTGDGFSAALAGSKFAFVNKTKLEKESVIAVNAGTNWRDKFNFAEIKLDMPIPSWVSAETRTDAQAFDKKSFNREGFRPFIVSTRQFPLSLLPSMVSGGSAPDLSGIKRWAQLLKSWYFDTHRMLNGTITFVGQPDFIGVGENIQFSSSLLSASPNMAGDSKNTKLFTDEDVLAHVESISHSFDVDQETGARSFRTTVQFVRGILVTSSDIGIIESLSGRRLDSSTTDTDRDTQRNTGIVKKSTNDDPDP